MRDAADGYVLFTDECEKSNTDEVEECLSNDCSHCFHGGMKTVALLISRLAAFNEF